MVKRFIGSILLVIIIITGCSSNQTSKISTEAKNTIEKISKIYGEQNPEIVDIKTTEEETTKKPMYIVFLEGNFQKGNQKSKKLEFSMTEDGTKVWALTSDNWQENEVNVTN
jgi:PBP1b-binding outer membrane lipoprotein LpoB